MILYPWLCGASFLSPGLKSPLSTGDDGVFNLRGSSLSGYVLFIKRSAGIPTEQSTPRHV